MANNQMKQCLRCPFFFHFFFDKKYQMTATLRLLHVFIDSSLCFDPFIYLMNNVLFISFKHSLKYMYLEKRISEPLQIYTNSCPLYYKNHAPFVYHTQVAYLAREWIPIDVFYSDWWCRQTLIKKHTPIMQLTTKIVS